MLVKLFKILTSISLVLVLGVLASTRDLTTLFSKESFLKLTKKESYQRSLPSQEEPVAQLQVKPSEEFAALPSLHTETSPSPSAQIQKTPPQVTKQETITPGTPYITLNEGVSDTDENYKPAISPCDEVMSYKIGSFDTRFGISKETFISEIDRGAKLWGDALGKKLFTYNKEGSLTINLIYDERQARTVDVSYLVLEIENAKRSAESLRTVYEKETDTYTRDGELFTRDSNLFQEDYKAYTQKVDEYNKAGGAPKAEYDLMTAQLVILKERAKSLDERRLALTTQMESINKKVARYNEFVAYINGLIRQSNALGAKKFTEGRFTPANNTIDIYQYDDITKLRRVIAHELGHVLGINHNNTLESIMYSVNSATSTSLSRQDVRDLVTACSAQ